MIAERNEGSPMTAQVLCECSRFQAQTGVENPIVSWSELRGQMGSGRLRWLGSEGQERGEGTKREGAGERRKREEGKGREGKRGREEGGRELGGELVGF